jgi:hypothetical protein
MPANLTINTNRLVDDTGTGKKTAGGTAAEHGKALAPQLLIFPANNYWADLQ